MRDTAVLSSVYFSYRLSLMICMFSLQTASFESVDSHKWCGCEQYRDSSSTQHGQI